MAAIDNEAQNAQNASNARPPRSKSGNDLAASAEPASATGLPAVDSPTSGSPPGSSAGRSAAANSTAANATANGIASTPKGEESLSATLERLRLNAQAAKNGAQNGGAAGAIGSNGRGPAPNSRLAKASAGANPAALANNPAAAAALARATSNAGSANGAPQDPQMSNFLFDDELDSELHNSTYGGRYLQMNADDDKFPVLIRRDSFPGITPPRNAFMRAEASGRTSEWPQFAASNATNTASTATTQGAAGAGNAAPAGPGAPAPNGANRLSADLSSVVNGARRGVEGSPRNRQLPPPRSATTGASPTSLPGTAPQSAATTATGASNGPASATTAPSSATTAATSATAPTSERSSPSLGDLNGGSPTKTAAQPNGQSGAQSTGPVSPEEMKRKAQLIRERERLERAANGPVNPVTHQAGHKFSDGTPSPAAKYANELAALNGTFSPYPLEGRNGGYGGPADQAYGPGGYGGNFNGRRGAPNGGGQQRKEEPNRFAGLRLEDLQGDMAALCKDQHGCRFLQKKLEEGNAEHRDMIFNEIYPHFGELMTDSFGNYLSQKLLEHCTDEQRDALLESISGELVSISLNMHGTRAVQKMIDYLSTQRQVQSLIMALNLNVVTLIKDLNGNHVVQKCLNTLPPEDNQFIYNAVAANCIEVATHRHGCCVLQRCIDHASESQRIQLVTEITYNSLTLVLDPFGNYVVQYVLDLNDSRFITAIVNQFRNNVCALSAQKFSSNVVEKCVRVADLEGRKQLISELIDKSRLERMLRDSFANYVVQTALDYAEPNQRAELVAIIRPVLPMIRNTPYGKRIQSKIQREGGNDGYGRGGWHHHPGMYHGPPPMGYYGMPYGGPPHGGPGPHQQGPHHGPPQGYPGPGGPQHYGPGAEGPMGRGAGPYGHQYPQHMAPPHMASPAISHTFSPSFGPTNAVPMDYPQPPNYPYL